MRAPSRRTIGGFVVAAPAALGTVWTVKKIMSAAEGALAHDEPENEEHKKAMDAIEKTANPPGFQPGAMSPPMKTDQPGGRETSEKIKEVKETAMTKAPGVFSWMRRNAKTVMGIGAGAIAFLSLMKWRRGRKDLSNAGESVIERVGGIAQEAADMLKETTADVRNMAIEELEKRIDNLRAA